MAPLEIVPSNDPLLPKLWKVGDIVTRDGTDEHIIVEMFGNDPVDNMRVRCTKEPAIYEGSTEPWTHLGDEELNLIRRYKWVRARSE